MSDVESPNAYFYHWLLDVAEFTINFSHQYDYLDMEPNHKLSCSLYEKTKSDLDQAITRYCYKTVCLVQNHQVIQDSEPIQCLKL